MKRSTTILISVGAGFFLLVGGTAAGAATGGNFILGKPNTATNVTSLTNSKGTALHLFSNATQPSLRVSNSVEVPGLNASEVGGMTASQLSAGSDGFTAPATDTPVTSLAEVASTAPLAQGTYYVNASALIDVLSGATQAFCGIVKGSSPGTVLQWGGGTTPGTGAWLTSAETLAVNVSSGDTLQEWCESSGGVTSDVYNASVTAIRIASSTGTAPAVAPHSRTAAPGR